MYFLPIRHKSIKDTTKTHEVKRISMDYSYFGISMDYSYFGISMDYSYFGISMDYSYLGSNGPHAPFVSGHDKGHLVSGLQFQAAVTHVVKSKR